ncbi:MAG TPA: PilZ domain-containing protein [Nitrospiraceae bacterium]|nr:PilZ domain-containing protein [Nitrospiraceae bacterium]
MAEAKSAFEHYERGRVLKQNQMFKEAIDEFKLAADDPRYIGKAHVQIALCLRSADRGEAAVVAFRRALTLATFSSQEKAHILYLLGQTLESLGRYAEALEAYGWTRKEDPGLQDVEQRIKHLVSGGRGPLPQHRLASQSAVRGLIRLGQQVTPHVLGLLGQAWNSISQYADKLGGTRGGQGQGPSFRDGGYQNGHRELTPARCAPSASRVRRKETRKHVRVAVRLRSHFSSKSRTVAGDGELRDLSPGGCRVKSSVAVPVGAELECCIFPEDAINPFTIEGAMVRWSRPQEFGLAFTNVRPGVQRQIAQLCRTRTPLGVEVLDGSQRSV